MRTTLALLLVLLAVISSTQSKTLKKGTEDDAPGDGVLVVDALGGDVPNDDASDDDASEDDALDDDAPIKDAPNKDAPGDDASDDDASDGDAPDDDPPDDDAPDSDASPKVVVLDDDSTDDDASDDDDRPKCRDTDPQECALFARDKRQCFWKIDTPDGYSRCRNTCWDCDISFYKYCKMKHCMCHDLNGEWRSTAPAFLQWCLTCERPVDPSIPPTFEI